MKKTYYIENFDPSNFDFDSDLNEPTIKRLRDHLENRRIPKPHSLMSKLQLKKSIDFMMLRDPLLGLLCSLSFRYTLQPFHQLASLRKKDIKGLYFHFRPMDSTAFKRSKKEIDLDDLRKLDPFLATSARSDYVFSNNPDLHLWHNLELRWDGLKALMVERKILSSTHTLFSYYTTSLDKWNEKMHYHQIADRLSIKKYMMVKYLFYSFGRIPPMNIIDEDDQAGLQDLDI